MNGETRNKKKIIIAAIIILVLAVGFVYWYWFRNQPQTSPTQTPTSTNEQTFDKNLKAAQRALTGQSKLQFPSIQSSQAIEPDSLPEILKKLVPAEAQELDVRSIIYSDSKTGFEIGFLENLETEGTEDIGAMGKAFLAFPRGFAKGWQIINALYGNEAGILEAESSQYKLRADFALPYPNQNRVRLVILIQSK